MNMGIKKSTKEHKVKGKGYVTLMCITDATKSARTVRMPKWLRFPLMILFVFIVWKSVSVYDYVVSLEAESEANRVAIMEQTKVNEEKAEQINELEDKLQNSTATKDEQLKALQEKAVELGTRLQDLEQYRSEMQQYRDAIDNSLGATGTKDTSLSTYKDDETTLALQRETEEFASSNELELSSSETTYFDTTLLTSSINGTIQQDGTADPEDTMQDQDAPIMSRAYKPNQKDLTVSDEDAFADEVEELSSYLDEITATIDNDAPKYEETNKSLEGIIPYVDAYPSVLPIKNTYITSPFGYRKNPFGRYTSEFHTGVDLKATYQEVRATGAGKVVFAGYDGSYGYMILIDHGYGLQTRYGHNSKLYVSVGDRVKRGDVISKSGNTGRSTGPHLHYEVILNGEPQNPLNYVYKEGK